MLGIFPNFDIVPATSHHVAPMTTREKRRLAAAEAFDPASFLSASAIAGIGQARHQYPSWGHGADGFGKRYGAAFADQAMGGYLTTAVFPILLHEDPRYFRRGQGTFFQRLGYASGRIVITRMDSGASRANYSEFLGNATTAAISNAYIPYLGQNHRKSGGEAWHETRDRCFLECTERVRARHSPQTISRLRT